MKPKKNEVALVLETHLRETGQVWVSEHRFANGRRWRFDWACPEWHLALEIEGGVWTQGRHVRGKGYIDDLEKYSEAAIRRWCILRVTPDQALSGEALKLVVRALDNRGCRVPDAALRMIGKDTIRRPSWRASDLRKNAN